MKKFVSDQVKSDIRLFWRNGGWVTLMISGTVVILFYLAFSAVVPVLREERIRNVRTDVIRLSEDFVNVSAGIRPQVWNSILKNKEVLSHPDSALSVCSEIMDKDRHISGLCHSQIRNALL